MAKGNHVAWLKTNVAPRAAARRLARRAVEARLAACANLVPIESVYWWKGEIVVAAEVAIVFKTDASLLSALRRFVEAHHPYDLPYVAWGRGELVTAPYARWVTAETAGARTRRSPYAKGRARPRTRS